jgi:hypothetical protein
MKEAGASVEIKEYADMNHTGILLALAHAFLHALKHAPTWTGWIIEPFDKFSNLVTVLVTSNSNQSQKCRKGRHSSSHVHLLFLIPLSLIEPQW